jgi:glycine dehydrogenase subunit 1
MTYMGPDGLRQVAEVSFKRAHALADRLTALPGWERAFPEREFLNEFPMRVPRSPAVLRKLARKGILGGLDAHRWFRELKGVLTFTCTEVNDPRALDELVTALEA